MNYREKKIKIAFALHFCDGRGSCLFSQKRSSRGKLDNFSYFSWL